MPCPPPRTPLEGGAFVKTSSLSRWERAGVRGGATEDFSKTTASVGGVSAHAPVIVTGGE